MSKILALYDIMGIQQYIYKTNKLKDIIGGSMLVEKALQEIPCNLLPKHGGRRVYSGGGNAIFSFATEEDYKAFTRIFSRKLLLQTPGIRFVTVCLQQGKDLSKSIDCLFKKIAQKKNTALQFCDFYTLPPMAQSNADQQQVVFYDEDTVDGGGLSFSAMQKKIMGKEITNEETKENKMINFNKIAKPFISRSENMMAVVHIDGNNMGDILSEAFKNISAPDEIAEISKQVDDAFKNAVDVTVEKLLQIEQDEAKKQDSAKVVDSPHYRLIYQNGDDVTFVCHSCYALAAVCTFFEALTTCKRDKLADLSASAGIAFIKPHYPFSKAYAVAHQRCEMAKKKARQKAKIVKDKFDIGFWLDYEIIWGSDQSKTMGQHEARPYYVCGLPETRIDPMEANIGMLAALLKTFNKDINFEKSSKDISRSKLKALRNTFLFNDTDYVSALMASTDQSIKGEYMLYSGKAEEGTIGDFQVDEIGYLKGSNRINVIYDALEIMDINTVPISQPGTREAINI